MEKSGEMWRNIIYISGLKKNSRANKQPDR